MWEICQTSAHARPPPVAHAFIWRRSRCDATRPFPSAARYQNTRRARRARRGGVQRRARRPRHASPPYGTVNGTRAASCCHLRTRARHIKPPLPANARLPRFAAENRAECQPTYSERYVRRQAVMPRAPAHHAARAARR